MEKKTNDKFKKFLVVWFGQFVSMLGSGISSFGLSLWIFMMTKSATSFAMTFLVQILPGILFAPLAGSFADRFHRKKIIIFTDSLDAVVKVFLVFLLLSKKMEVWMVYPITFISQSLGTFQNPAFNASIPLLVNKEDIPRANGLMQLIRSIQNMIAPIIAGALFAFIGLAGLFIIDFITFFVAIFTILPQKFDQKIEDNKNDNFAKTIVEDLKIAGRVLKSKQGFISLIVVFSILNFIANIVMVLLGPLVMSNFDTKIYGLVNSISGVAMVIGGFFAGAIPSKEHKVKSVFLSLIISSFGMIIMGVHYHWIVIAIGMFIFMLPTPYANGTLGSLIQLKIENRMLGRVSALIDCLMKIITPLAIIISGFLADDVFNPLLVKGGSLSDTVIGKLLGVGKGRGIGLLFVICGILLLTICLYMFFNKNVNRLEEVNPDVLE